MRRIRGDSSPAPTHQVATGKIPSYLAHPFELTVGLMAVTAGSNSISYLTTIGRQIRIGLLALPLPLLWVWILAIIIGAALIIVSYVQPNKLMVRATERAGLCLTGAAWLALGVVSAHLDPSHPGNWLQYDYITLGCVLRLVALHRQEKALLKAAEVKAVQMTESDS